MIIAGRIALSDSLAVLSKGHVIDKMLFENDINGHIIQWGKTQNLGIACFESMQAQFFPIDLWRNLYRSSQGSFIAVNVLDGNMVL